MNQRTHSWIAIRAIALLEEEDKKSNLVKLLKPHTRKASVGAWIPDQADAKLGGSAVENHILKIEPYAGKQRARFVTRKEVLLKHLGEHRLTSGFLRSDTSLDDQWWDTPYRGDVPKPGQHLPNRAMALGTMLKDLLLLGDERIDALIPGKPCFLKDMDDGARTREAAAAMYFFMLSHFLADASMPCHCDGRLLAKYEQGLHKELEKYWSGKVGTGFEKKNLLTDPPPGQTLDEALADSAAVLQEARGLDGKFNLNFQPSIPDLNPGHDIWLEVIHLCRASFAVASIIAPYRDFPYDNREPTAPFDKLLGGGNKQLLESLSQVVMHDAILNTAIVWKHIWSKLSKKENG
jgi:hypothetical protein